ncbi:DNA/RNA helicase domain-containing protein [Vibrio sp. Vb2880]|uniref:DNA/RNA helicase domain-containing protein n=1 Tax=Vibrio TaxID=662 RepID=UPI00296411E7|nr:DNA/RNA helicase domain-containing protein [Vibrio sp. Vb2880]MDW1577998.1 DNA/RNA helicase domain-containing protein [Vibrio sp. Vb2880]
MRSINILSLVQAYRSLSQTEYESFIKYYEIDIKNTEVNDLENMILIMRSVLDFVNVFNDFFVGYKIQHISKEFDLLRFGRNYTVNIELKSNSNESKIENQLLRNRYYLSHTNKVIHNFTFVSQTKKIYLLNSYNKLEETNFNFLLQILTGQNLSIIDNPDNLFNPSDYLVSPFNSTNKFINGQYFLTNQQEDIKNQIFNNLNSIGTSFIAVTGSAGTGKTLLTYDVVKSFISNKKAVIVHCGQLNEGHRRLIGLGWNIVSIKEFRNYDISNLDLVVIDEAQRIFEWQFNNLVSDAQMKNISCIFSYDKSQTLSRKESLLDIEGKINNIHGSKLFKLSDKIRTNKEIASFIKLLFNNKRKINIKNEGNIDFDYFNDVKNVKDYIDLISNNGWEVLKLTPSQYDKEYHESYSNLFSKNSHRVIGQEFDNVAVVIDQYFSYSNDGKLIYRSKTHYDSVKMLFQNITRTRKKLKLIIIGNREVLNRCLSIFQ